MTLEQLLYLMVQYQFYDASPDASSTAALRTLQFVLNAALGRAAAEGVSAGARYMRGGAQARARHMGRRQQARGQRSVVGASSTVSAAHISSLENQLAYAQRVAKSPHKFVRTTGKWDAKERIVALTKELASAKKSVALVKAVKPTTGPGSKSWRTFARDRRRANRYYRYASRSGAARFKGRYKSKYSRR